MSLKQGFSRKLALAFSDDNFLSVIKKIEGFVSKVLSLAMIAVILVAIFDLILLLGQELFSPPLGFFNRTLIEVFGLFLNVLIALEILENITAYLRKHVVQVELVVVTSLTAVARKIIIFDFSKATGIDLIGLAVAILSLAVSYWLLRRTNDRHQAH
ncbi:phosphate-starvation-inducible PsiE family protein [Leptolyngbya sp. FACHB-261]|uniref:phosphate-starvation-inducible PsiE family protein n=1 Tax=Leptolyngbya sp. FACHB-261 TaxID=2692806 RepID=UPI0016877370|nr:phosphate-starvation-inducible PsiE family protein [Leptolyngbya sp. FACHB-261]MBD2103087.1 phosphate-starvation-inducible PsiE family protein [Leptolyngbya sp. FACHB-261]